MGRWRSFSPRSNELLRILAAVGHGMLFMPWARSELVAATIPRHNNLPGLHAVWNRTGSVQPRPWDGSTLYLAMFHAVPSVA
jgi:hypothetical protein